MFDLLNQLFKQNYDELSLDFIQKKQPSALVDKDKRAEIENLHDAYINEMKNSFS